MRNAVFYAGSWLMPNSTAKELYDKWKSQPTTENKKKLDDHVKSVDASYKKLHG